MKKEKLILKRLGEHYKDVKSGLDYNNCFELLIAVILSAQCTDKRVNVVTKRLFAKCPTAEHFCKLSEEQLEELIHDCGLFRTKAKNIKKTCQILVDEYNGEVPNNLDDLIKLPGVGRKTANVVLSQGFGKPAIAVDTHVFRTSKRLGLALGIDVEKTEQELMKVIPKKDWSAAHHWLIWHGRLVCKAQRPLCNGCFLFDICPFYEKTT